MTIRDLLQRFRPAGAPGAAMPAAVPADRGAEAAAELRVVFAALDDTHAEAARIAARAITEAADRRRWAAGAADRIIAAARRSAQDTRADAFATARAGAARADTELLAEAEHQADALRARARQRMAECVPPIVAAGLRHAYGAGEATP
ncbi:hypothetical protein [Dactylosporangium sp. NPDC005555]|uniref:hypothetical protein n=1 Tax=Dactylosporangium sp. NPDC005555 TaxID=3154889 RepID=UPI0033A525FB